MWIDRKKVVKRLIQLGAEAADDGIEKTGLSFDDCAIANRYTTFVSNEHDYVSVARPPVCLQPAPLSSNLPDPITHKDVQHATD